MLNTDPFRKWQSTIFNEISDGEEFELRHTVEELVALGAGSGITVEDFLALLHSRCDADQLVDAAAYGLGANST